MTQKMNYQKIDIFIDGEYRASTTWSKTCKEAKARYIAALGVDAGKVTAFFDKRSTK